MIQIKDTSILKALLARDYHPTLIDIIMWTEDTYGKVVITSGYRYGDRGCHGTLPCRAIDIRSWVYADPEEIAEAINKHWTYDFRRKEKKCAMVHDVGKGIHFHIQVHPNTRREDGV